MDFSDNPITSKAVFHVKYGQTLVGILEYDNGTWKYQYSPDYKTKKGIAIPIIDFPDLGKVYTNNQLWPFFASRIPTINQPFQVKKIKKARIKSDDSVGLLRIFGNDTINNPYKLLAL
jgi:HipA-like protein